MVSQRSSGKQSRDASADDGGSWLNAAKSLIGDVTGETDRRLDKFGVRGDKNRQEFLRVVNLAQQQQ